MIQDKFVGLIYFYNSKRVNAKLELLDAIKDIGGYEWYANQPVWVFQNTDGACLQKYFNSDKGHYMMLVKNKEIVFWLPEEKITKKELK